jgi:hypothetical protein
MRKRRQAVFQSGTVGVPRIGVQWNVSVNTARGIAAGLSVLLGAIVPYGQAASSPIAEASIAFEKNLPLVSFRLNDRPLTLILDSASRNCLIEAGAAAGSGIDAGERAFSSGSGGLVEVRLAHGVRLRLQRVELDPDYVVVTSLGHLRFGRPVHGVVGLPLFRKYVIEIDYRASTVRFYSPAEYRPPATGHIIRAWMTDGPTVGGRLRLPTRLPLISRTHGSS